MSALAIEPYTAETVHLAMDASWDLYAKAENDFTSKEEEDSILEQVNIIDLKLKPLMRMVRMSWYAHAGNFVSSLVPVPKWLELCVSATECTKDVSKIILARQSARRYANGRGGLQRCTSFDELVQHTLTNCG